MSIAGIPHALPAATTPDTTPHYAVLCRRTAHHTTPAQRRSRQSTSRAALFTLRSTTPTLGRSSRASSRTGRASCSPTTRYAVCDQHISFCGLPPRRSRVHRLGTDERKRRHTSHIAYRTLHTTRRTPRVTCPPRSSYRIVHRSLSGAGFQNTRFAST